MTTTERSELTRIANALENIAIFMAVRQLIEMGSSSYAFRADIDEAHKQAKAALIKRRPDERQP